MQRLCQKASRNWARIMLGSPRPSLTETPMRTQATIRILNRLIRTCRDGEEICGAG